MRVLLLLLSGAASQPALAATTVYTDRAAFAAALANVTDYVVVEAPFFVGRGAAVSQNGVTFQASAGTNVFGLGPSDGYDHYGGREFPSFQNNGDVLSITGVGRAFGLTYASYNGTNGVTFSGDGFPYATSTPSSRGTAFVGVIADAALPSVNVATNGLVFDVVGFALGQARAVAAVPEPAG